MIANTKKNTRESNALTSALQAGKLMVACFPISEWLEIFESITTVLSSQS